MNVVKEVKIKNRYYLIVKEEYANGNTALLLVKRSNPSDCRTLTTNVSHTLPSSMVTIKDYSENTGTLAMLLEHEIVGSPLYYEESGYVKNPVCLLLT